MWWLWSFNERALLSTHGNFGSRIAVPLLVPKSGITKLQAVQSEQDVRTLLHLMTAIA
jgi:hypothetical protein